MYLQEILEVTVGLVFMWMVISIAVMQMNEWFFRKRRANELFKTIKLMLGSDELTRAFYKHPLIAGIYTNARGRIKSLPDYITDSDFTTVLFDLIMKAGSEDSPLLNVFGDIFAEIDKIQNSEHKKLAKSDWSAIVEVIRGLAGTPIGQAALAFVRLAG